MAKATYRRRRRHPDELNLRPRYHCLQGNVSTIPRPSWRSSIQNPFPSCHSSIQNPFPYCHSSIQNPFQPCHFTEFGDQVQRMMHGNVATWRRGLSTSRTWLNEVEQISGEEIPSPGVYLPYPCYKLDR